MRENYFPHVFVLPAWADEVRVPLTDAVDKAQETYDLGRYDLTLDRWLDRLRADSPW
jgi:arabinofuranosyltransferase